MSTAEFLVNHFIDWLQSIPEWQRDESAIDRIIAAILDRPEDYTNANWPSVYKSELD